MPDIKGLFPRAPSVYGRVNVGEEDLILDLVHNTFRRCYFKDCKIIIPETLHTLMVQSLFDCQFDDCEITIIKRVGFDIPENRNVHPSKHIVTPVALHVDVTARPTSNKNLITVRVDQAIKEKLGQQRSIEWMRYLMTQSTLFSSRFR